MKFKLILLFSISFLICSVLKAQNLSISGKIIDVTNDKSVESATIKCDNFGTSSIKDGSFRLIIQKEKLLKYGLSVTCIGYENQKVNYQENNNYIIKLKPSEQVLNEVIVGISATDIVRKAILNIPKNYPQKDFTMEGFIKMVQTVKNDTANYKFFQNEAIVKVGVSAYTKNASETKVTVIQNRYIKADSLQREQEYIRFVNAYLLPQNDYVHKRYSILNINKLNNYDFNLNGKTIINRRKSYVINFNNLEKGTEEGIIYIDTATFAIAKINRIVYNLEGYGFIKIDQGNSIATYKISKSKWYLQNSSYLGKSKHNGLNYDRTEEYHTLKIDSEKLDVNYTELVQYSTEDLKINKLVDDKDWDKYNPIIDSLTNYQRLADVKIPPSEKNIEPSSFGYKILNGLRDYVIKGGLRSTYQFNQSPINLNGYQPALNKSLSTVNYNLSFDYQFRLYHHIFFELGVGTNYGLGGVKFNQNSCSFSCDINLNKNHHPIILSPQFGYSNISLSKKKETYYTQEDIVYGLRIGYEKKRSTAYFVSLKYYQNLSKSATNLNIQNINIVPSIGILNRF